MVLPHFFSKSSPKKKTSESSNPAPDKTRPANSPSRSPQKKTSPTKRPHRSSRQSSARDTHPLNLPPDERERRRSAYSAMSDPPTSMDMDQEDASSADPSSPPPSTQGTSSGSNGVNHANGPDTDDSPIPPPHKNPTSPPPQPKPAVDAEACKSAGNKFFMMKDYDKAIREYTKGITFMDCLAYARVDAGLLEANAYRFLQPLMPTLDLPPTSLTDLPLLCPPIDIKKP